MTSIVYIDIEQLELSDLNPRETRPEEDIQQLADRMIQNGFEPTRALWAYQVDDRYKIFAGGTRLKAAKLAEIKEIPIVLYEDLSESDITKLAYQDNENDDYHKPIPTVDVWSNYAKRKAEGWTQQQIAEAVGVDQATVSRRLKFNDLSDKIKGFMNQGFLTEKHLAEIIPLCTGAYFEPWLTTDQAHEELAQLAIGKTVRDIKQIVEKWKSFIELAEKKYNLLKKWQVEFEEKNSPKWTTRWCDELIQQLSEGDARTKAAINEAYTEQRNDYQEAIDKHKLELAEQISQAEAEKLRLEQEKQKQKVIDDIIANIHHGDFREVCRRFEDDSVDIIITDPPYPKEYLSLYGQLAEVAARILKPGGFLMVMCGQSYLPEIFSLMTPYIKYRWTINYQTQASGEKTQLWDRKVWTSWKPILWFVKGDNEGWYHDKVSSDGRDKDHDNWGQSEGGIYQWIEVYTESEDLILDPFFGGGTTGIAALKLKRKFIGIDNDIKKIEISKERIYNFLND